MKLRTLFLNTLVLLLTMSLTVPALAQNADGKAEPDKVVEIEGTDDLKFTKENIRVKPGQVVKVKLTTVSDYPKQAMAHNFLLVALDANVDKVASKSAQAHKNDYVAEGMDEAILAHTGMAGDGETVSVTFTVPEKPGDYPYICTFPGHYSSGMEGTLQVSSSKASL